VLPGLCRGHWHAAELDPRWGKRDWGLAGYCAAPNRRGGRGDNGVSQRASQALLLVAVRVFALPIGSIHHCSRAPRVDTTSERERRSGRRTSGRATAWRRTGGMQTASTGWRRTRRETP
jgi:hypothetical protein